MITVCVALELLLKTAFCLYNYTSESAYPRKRFASNKSEYIVSKGLERSMNKAQTDLFLSTAQFQISNVLKR